MITYIVRVSVCLLAPAEQHFTHAAGWGREGGGGDRIPVISRELCLYRPTNLQCVYRYAERGRGRRPDCPQWGIILIISCVSAQNAQSAQSIVLYVYVVSSTTIVVHSSVVCTSLSFEGGRKGIQKIKKNHLCASHLPSSGLIN